ncbi:MAG: hypothetical protein AB1898_15645 [Acidobacteriota bacterium]
MAAPLENKAVPGAPYSAEAVSEHTQILGDGNRIYRKSSTLLYRDRLGRTRKEQSFSPSGRQGEESLSTIFINDPIQKVQYVLNPKERTAHKLVSFEWYSEGEAPKAEAGAAAETRDFQVFVQRAEGPAGPPPIAGARIMHFERVRSFAKPVVESLGKETIDGLEVEGSRSTLTIPAGQIGNDLPIQVVSESWFSQELQLVIRSKHTDPRFGETTYRLTNITRKDQPQSLFEIPADYTIQKQGEIARIRTMKTDAAP